MHHKVMRSATSSRSSCLIESATAYFQVWRWATAADINMGRGDHAEKGRPINKIQAAGYARSFHLATGFLMVANGVQLVPWRILNICSTITSVIIFGWLCRNRQHGRKAEVRAKRAKRRDPVRSDASDSSGDKRTCGKTSLQ